MSTPNPHKPYRLKFEARPQYLFARVEAETDSYEISRTYWEEIAHECKVSNWKKLLVEESIPDGFSVAEAFQLASELPQMGLFGVKIAFVDLYADEQAEVNRFSELVAVNRGINTKVFESVAAAEQWLLSG